MLKVKKKIDKQEFTLRAITLSVSIIAMAVVFNFFVLSMTNVKWTMEEGLEMMNSAENVTSPLNETVYNKGLIYIGFSMDLLIIVVVMLWMITGIMGYLLGSSVFYFIRLFTGKLSWDEWRKQVTNDIETIKTKKVKS